MNDFDVIVLGGGTAGSSAASAAAAAGARTAMVNDGELGGLCILRGCMPTKAMLASAHAIHEAEQLDPFGARLEGRVVPDFARIMSRKDSQVARFKRAKIASVEAGDYELIDGRARFAEGASVRVGERTLRAKAYVVATGSEPIRLAIPGIDEVAVLTSDDVMRLTSPPSRLLVQGGGPIGLELAQFFSRIGTEVLLVNRSPLLWRHDAECGEALHRALADEPRFELVVPGRITRLRRQGSGLVAEITDEAGRREWRADALLMAAGRRAALDDLGLPHVGLEPADGALAHDEHMATANPAVFVAGDATGRFQILHLGSQEGSVAGHNAAGARPPWTMDYRLKMAVVFTDPPFAHVGTTEAEAREQGRALAVGRASLSETGRAITMETRHGLWKLYADRDSGEILGSAIVGPRADDLIHLIATMMHYGGRVDDIFQLPWYHPTLSEVMLNLGRDLRPRPPCDARP